MPGDFFPDAPFGPGHATAPPWRIACSRAFYQRCPTCHYRFYIAAGDGSQPACEPANRLPGAGWRSPQGPERRYDARGLS